MQSIHSVNENLRQSIKTEHYRLHSTEEWPDSPYKEAVLAAVRSALGRLEAAAVERLEPACMICAARRTRTKVVMFPSVSKASSEALRPAA